MTTIPAYARPPLPKPTRRQGIALLGIDPIRFYEPLSEGSSMSAIQWRRVLSEAGLPQPIDGQSYHDAFVSAWGQKGAEFISNLPKMIGPAF